MYKYSVIFIILYCILAKCQWGPAGEEIQYQRFPRKVSQKFDFLVKFLYFLLGFLKQLVYKIYHQSYKQSVFCLLAWGMYYDFSLFATQPADTPHANIYFHTSPGVKGLQVLRSRKARINNVETFPEKMFPKSLLYLFFCSIYSFYVFLKKNFLRSIMIPTMS